MHGLDNEERALLSGEKFHGGVEDKLIADRLVARGLIRYVWVEQPWPLLPILGGVRTERGDLALLCDKLARQTWEP